MRFNFISQHKAFFSITILLAAIIVAVQGSAYYYYQESNSSCPNPCGVPTVKVETLINYGNGTIQWINKTDVPSNWNFYQLTDSIAKVEATFSSSISAHFVSAINGVRGRGQYFWSLWAVCQKSNAWIATSVGADAIHFSSYHTFAWYYQTANSQDSSNWNPPVSGAAKVTVC